MTRTQELDRREEDGNVKEIEAFPILISSEKNFLNKNQLNIIKSFIEKHNSLKAHNAIINDIASLSSHNSDANCFLEELIQLNNCENIINKINLRIKKYLEKTGFRLGNPFWTPPSKMDSWFNIQNKGSVLKQHLHYNSVVSGALFINIEKNCSPIVFDNPNTNLFMGLRDIDVTKKFSHEEITIFPENGQLLLFPSFLRHGSGGIVNNSYNRIVISFNVQ